MTRDERVYYYQNLLILAAIPFIIVLLKEIDERYDFTLREPPKCSAIHHNAPYDRRCTP